MCIRHTVTYFRELAAYVNYVRYACLRIGHFREVKHTAHILAARYDINKIGYGLEQIAIYLIFPDTFPELRISVNILQPLVIIRIDELQTRFFSAVEKHGLAVLLLFGKHEHLCLVVAVSAPAAEIDVIVEL